MTSRIENSSFRDPDGYVFYMNGKVYRAIMPSYLETYKKLTSENFFEELVQKGRVVQCTDAPQMMEHAPGAAHVAEVQKIPFISYSPEWTFGQYKSAALRTLRILQEALKNGFTLKDASAYNVQFNGNKAVFIDVQSFALYREGDPWAAYGQFCRHFLAPMLLMSRGFGGAGKLMLSHIDGIPLSLASSLLPFFTRFSFFTYTHLHLHAKFESRHAAASSKPAKLQMSKSRLVAMITHLENGIRNLKQQGAKTNWTDYYDTFSYNKEGFEVKRTFVDRHASLLQGDLCVDLGANTGEFSDIAAAHFKYVVACDNDGQVVNAMYEKKKPNVLPLVIDLANPTPAYGWNSRERASFTERISKADLTLALALIHHLRIGNNVPLSMLARFFSGISKRLIIEFVPKSDEQVRKLLVTRADIFDDYHLEGFMREFSVYFTILDHCSVPGSDRVLFMLEKKSPDVPDKN